MDIKTPKTMGKARNVLENLDTAVRQIVELFAKIYYECGLDSEYIYNVGGDPIGVWGMGDEFWGFDDMVTALRYDADKETLMNWYEHQIGNAVPDEPVINLKSWLKGFRPEETESNKEQSHENY